MAAIEGITCADCGLQDQQYAFMLVPDCNQAGCVRHLQQVCWLPLIMHDRGWLCSKCAHFCTCCSISRFICNLNFEVRCARHMQIWVWLGSAVWLLLQLLQLADVLICPGVCKP